MQKSGGANALLPPRFRRPFPLYSGPTESSLRLIGRPVTSINQCHKKGAELLQCTLWYHFSPPKKEYVVREAIFLQLGRTTLVLCRQSPKCASLLFDQGFPNND